MEQMETYYKCNCGFIFSPDDRVIKSDFHPSIIDTNVKKWITFTSTEISKLQQIQILDIYSLALDSENVVFNYDIQFILNSLIKKNKAIQIGGNLDALDRKLVGERVRKFWY